MRTVAALTGTLLLLLGSLTAWAADSPPRSVTSQGMASSEVDAGESRFEINAATDDSNATVKIGRTRSVGPGLPGHRSYFDTLTASATAPLAKGGGSTSLATNAGFPDAFTVTGKYSRLTVMRRIVDPADPKLKSIREEMQANALAEGVSADDVKDLVCDSGNVATYAASRLDEFDALFWDDSKPTIIWGGSGTVGRRDFEFLQDDLNKQSQSKTPWGFSAFAAVIPPTTETLLTAGVAYRRQWKDADETTLCPASGTSASITCKSGPGAAPIEATQKIAFAEWRHAFKKRAVSLKIEYDFENKLLAAGLPIYLLPSGDSGLGGGIRIDWVEAKGASFGVFVSKVFSLFPE